MAIIGEITLKPQAFASAVAWAAKWLDARPVVPAHAGLSLVIDDTGTLHIGAGNENVTARAMVAVQRADLEAQSAAGTSRAMVSGRLLAGLVGTFGDKPVTITGDGQSVFLRTGRFSVSLPMMDESYFPAPAESPPVIGSVAGDILASAVGRVAIVAESDPSKGLMYAGVYAGFDDKEITLIATDRYRAASVAVPWTPGAGNRSASQAVVLGQVLRDAAAGFTGPGNVDVGLSGSAISLTSPTRSITVRLIDLGAATYPVETVLGFLAADHPTSAVLTVDDMAAPLKRAWLIRGKDGNPVRLTFTDGTVTIGSHAGDTTQKGDEEVDARYEGDEVTFAFSPKYLADALATVHSPSVRMEFESPKAAVVLSSDDDPRWRHVIMPVR